MSTSWQKYVLPLKTTPQHGAHEAVQSAVDPAVPPNALIILVFWVQKSTEHNINVLFNIDKNRLFKSVNEL